MGIRMTVLNFHLSGFILSAGIKVQISLTEIMRVTSAPETLGRKFVVIMWCDFIFFEISFH